MKRAIRENLIKKIGLIDKHNSNIKNNNITYVKNICTLNSYLEKDIKSSFRIKEFETSRKIEGKKKKFKNAWKIIKMVE